jgi:hypothetical protein
MDVAPSGVVDIHVDQARTPRRMGDDQTGLFPALPHHCLLRRLALIEVTAGLQPPVKTAVTMEHHSPVSDDDCRCGQMGGVGVLVKRSAQAFQLSQDDLPGQRLSLIGSPVLLHHGPNPCLRWVAHVNHCGAIGETACSAVATTN